jgi:transcription elongation factor SPT5
MSTSNLLDTHFDDSEDEEENFNPEPELSDAEDAGGSDHDESAGQQIRNESARRRPSVNDDEGSDEEPTISKRRDGEEDEDEEDAEGEGEDIGRNDEEDEEDEEDDDEEEITVSFQAFPRLVFHYYKF